MSAPKLVSTPGSYTVTWSFTDVEIGFEADRLRSHSDGRLQARVRIIATPGAGEAKVLHHGQLNLSAGRSRKSLSKDLEPRLRQEGLDWDRVIEESCRLVLEAEDQVSPVERLTPTSQLDVNYLIRPLLLDGQPVVWFAPGGSGKSFLALYSALLVQNGLPFFDEPVRQANVLFLDWEATQEEAARRCTLLANGLAQTYIGRSLEFPFYRRCLAGIENEASEIAKEIALNDIGLVIVDSAGAACGGDIMSGELAINLFNTLRKVTASTNAAVEILTHTTKADRREENHRRLPIGSVYFENLARATWELRPQETNDGRVLRVGMFSRKSNNRRPEPIGLELSFQRDAVCVDQAAISDDANSEQGATQELILGELARGPVSVSDLTEAVGTTSGAVRVALSKLKARGLATNPVRGSWELVDCGEPQV